MAVTAFQIGAFQRGAFQQVFPIPPIPPTPSGGGGGIGGAGGNMLGRGKYFRPPTRHGGTLRMPWEKGKKPSREVIHKPAVDDEDDEDAIWLLLLDDP